MAKGESSRVEDEDIKSGSSSMQNQTEYELAEDYEVHHKKDAPPRFSTIFDSKPAPVIVEPVAELPRRKERHGIVVPLPIFILGVVAFFFETMIIVAYTTIGLYNQLPGRLGVMAGHSTMVCDGVSSQPHYQVAPAAPINIAPNFVIANAQPATETVSWMGRLPMTLSLSSSSSVSTSSSTSSSSSTTSSSSSFSGVVVTTTPGGVATSVVVVTASLSSHSDAAPSTITTVVVASPSSSQSTSGGKRDASTESTTSSTSTSASSTSTPPTTPAPTSTSSSSSSTTSATTSKKKGAGVCFGGAGAVALNCIDT